VQEEGDETTKILTRSNVEQRGRIKEKNKKNADVPDGELKKRKIEVHATRGDNTSLVNASGLSDCICDVCLFHLNTPAPAAYISRRTLYAAPASHHSAKPLPSPLTPTVCLCSVEWFLRSYNCCAPPCAVSFPFTPFLLLLLLGEVDMDEMTFCTLFS